MCRPDPGLCIEQDLRRTQLSVARESELKDLVYVPMQLCKTIDISEGFLWSFSLLLGGLRCWPLC